VSEKDEVEGRERQEGPEGLTASDSLEPLRGAEAPSNSGGGGAPAAIDESGSPRAVIDDGQEGLEGREGRERQDRPSDAVPSGVAPGAEVKAILEALIFASPEPLTRKAIDKLLASEPKEDVDAAIEQLKQVYEQSSGLQLVEVAGGYQIVTRQDLHEWVRRLFHERTTQKLTLPALESLAVIAYRQPITAAEITEIRGVNTSGVLNTLLERHLIKIVGRKRVVGRPFLYATTKEFLIRFGLNDLSDLPKVEDMAAALGFEPPALLVEQTPGEEALPLEEPDELDEDGSSGSVH
jgi:segregation and condensation protein B